MYEAIKPCLLDEVTFIVTAVSAKQYEKEHFRKDGSGSFTTAQWALTVIPTLGSGFSNDFSYTVWTKSDDVADLARSLIQATIVSVTTADGSVNDIIEPRLAFRNGPVEWVAGEVKPNKDSNYRDNRAVWLNVDLQPDFGVVEMPKSRDAGNIAVLKAAFGGLIKTQVIDTANKPF